MIDMMSGMAFAVVVGLLLLAVVVGVAVYLGVQAAQRPSAPAGARETLQQRLAAGELSVEEYHERESALRSSETAGVRRR